MFNRRRYTLRFKKTRQNLRFDTWHEVSDAFLISSLQKLQLKYDFDVKSTKIKNSFADSYITIKCKKEDKNKIFTDYCLLLRNNITQVSF